MFRVVAWIGLIVVVALIAGALPLYAQQAGLTLESLAKRVDVLFAGQEYMTQRMTALETVVALSSEQMAVVIVTATPIPTATLTPLPTPSFTPVPTSTPEPTATATRRPSATPTPTLDSSKVTASRRLLLRGGPSNNHSIVVYVEKGDEFAVIGQNLPGTWIQVNYDGNIGWLPARYGEGVNDIPIVATPTPTPTETPTPAPTATMEAIGDDLFERLVEVVKTDILAAGDDEDRYSIPDVATEYFRLLGDLEPFCDMTKMELIELVEPHAVRIDEEGISESTGWWARWSLMNGMKEYLSETEADCSEYIDDYTSWILVKYRAGEIEKKNE